MDSFWLSSLELGLMNTLQDEATVKIAGKIVADCFSHSYEVVRKSGFVALIDRDFVFALRRYRLTEIRFTRSNSTPRPILREKPWSVEQALAQSDHWFVRSIVGGVWKFPFFLNVDLSSRLMSALNGASSDVRLRTRG